MSAADLRVMHHWSTFTWNKLSVGQPGMDQVLQITLPSLAFEKEWLLHGVLAVASLHMQRLLPDSVELQRQTSTYRVKAVSGFRQALSQINPTDNDSYEAALLMAILLVVLCSQDNDSEYELVVVNWLVLYQGLNTVMHFRPFGEVALSKVAPVFNRQITKLIAVPIIPTLLMSMMANVSIDDPDYGYVEDYCRVLDSVAALFASASQDGLTAPLFTRIITFPSYFGVEFLAFAKAKRPRALVILAWYLSFMKLIKGLWWIQGLPERDIKAINRILDPEWDVFMEVPRRIVNIDEPEEVLKLLLG